MAWITLSAEALHTGIYIMVKADRKSKSSIVITRDFIPYDITNVGQVVL